MQTKFDEAKFQFAIYQAGKTSGSATGALKNLLLSGHVNWGDTKRIALMARNYCVGRLAGFFKLTREQAEAVAALKPYKAGDETDDKHRTPEQQACWRAAITAWSYAAQQAGMPNRRTGKRRPNKVRPTTATNIKIDPVTAALAVEKPANPNDVIGFISRVAKLCNAYVARSKGMVQGEAFALLTDFATRAKALSDPELDKELPVPGIGPTRNAALAALKRSVELAEQASEAKKATKRAARNAKARNAKETGLVNGTAQAA